MESANVQSSDMTSAARSGWSLARSLAAHLGLGFVCLVFSAATDIDKYLFCSTPQGVRGAEGAAFGSWLLAGVAVCWLWGTGRRYPLANLDRLVRNCPDNRPHRHIRRTSSQLWHRILRREARANPMSDPSPTSTDSPTASSRHHPRRPAGYCVCVELSRCLHRVVAFLLGAGALAAVGVATSPIARSASIGYTSPTLARNGLIAYDSDVASPVPEVYVMNPDGSHKRRLTQSGNNVEPSWSPDGRLIVFVQGGKSSAALWVMNADGSGRRRLTSGLGIDHDPRWSPDGRSIAFSRGSCDPKCDIYVMRPDGSRVHRLTRDGHSFWPTWAPDSSRIAFSRDKSGINRDRTDIYVMKEDGTGPRDLTSLNRSSGFQPNSFEPAWSPDGQTIVFSYYGCDGCDTKLAFMNPDGSHVRHLKGGPGGLDQPAWSPDGKWIVLQTQQTLWVINAAGTTGRRIAFNGDNHNPSWQPLK
jgi:WD40-like Beta Propeller Repeat